MSKKSMKRIAVLALVCIVVCTLVSCATKLSGTYTLKDGLVEQSFTFKDDNRVEMSAFGIDVEGDYVIEDGKIIITYSFFGLSYDWENSFEKDGNTILINGMAFEKVNN